MVSTKTKDLRAVSVHEAGHSVVVILSGGRLKSVVLQTCGESGSATKYGPFPFAPYQSATRHLTASLAGIAAEHIYRNESLRPSFSFTKATETKHFGFGDYADAVDEARSLNDYERLWNFRTSQKEREKIVRVSNLPPVKRRLASGWIDVDRRCMVVLSIVERILRRNFRAVRAVARELLRRTNLSHADVVRLMIGASPVTAREVRSRLDKLPLAGHVILEIGRDSHCSLRFGFDWQDEVLSKKAVERRIASDLRIRGATETLQKIERDGRILLHAFRTRLPVRPGVSLSPCPEGCELDPYREIRPPLGAESPMSRRYRR